MQLAEFLRKERLTVAEFAQKCKISGSTIYAVLSKKKVAFRTARLIEQKTHREVTIDDIVRKDD